MRYEEFGDILGAVVAIMIASIVFGLPIVVAALLWLYRNDLESEFFKERFEVIIEDINVEHRPNRHYYILFMLRRLIFVLTVTLVPDNAYF